MNRRTWLGSCGASAFTLLLGLHPALTQIVASEWQQAASAVTGTLLTATIPEGFDHPRVTLVFARVIYEAEQGDDWLRFDGPTLFLVRFGTLQVRSNFSLAPVPRTLQARAGELATLALNTEHALSVGDGILTPRQTPIALHNAASIPVEAWAISLLASARVDPGYLLATSGDVWPLLGQGEITNFTAPASVRLERTILEVGSKLDLRTANGVALVHVEAGLATAEITEGLAEASSGAILRTGAIGPGAIISAGETRRIQAEDAIFLTPGSTVRLHAGDAPASLLLLHVTPSDERSTLQSGRIG